MEVYIISSGILAVALILNLIGSVLKYRTGTPNELLAIVLTVISFVLWCLIGTWKTLSFMGSINWYSIIVENGIFLGLPTVAMAITGWDILHGIHRFWKSRKTSGKKGEASK